MLSILFFISFSSAVLGKPNGFYYQPAQASSPNFYPSKLVFAHHVPVPMVPMGYPAYAPVHIEHGREPLRSQPKPIAFDLPDWVSDIRVFSNVALGHKNEEALDHIQAFLSSAISRLVYHTPEDYDYNLNSLWLQLKSISRVCPARSFFGSSKLQLASKINLLGQCVTDQPLLDPLIREKGLSKGCQPNRVVEAGHRYFLEASKIAIFLNGYKKALGVLDFGGSSGNELRHWAKKLDDIRVKIIAATHDCKNNWRPAVEKLVHGVYGKEPGLQNDEASRRIFDSLAENIPWRRWIVVVFDDMPDLFYCSSGREILRIHIDDLRHVLIFSTETMEPSLSGPAVKRRIKRVLNNIHHSGSCLPHQTDNTPFVHAILDHGLNVRAHGHFDDSSFWHNFADKTFFIWYF